MTWATIWKVGIFDTNEKALLNQRVGKVIPEEDKILPKYLFYICRTSDFQDQVNKYSLGWAQPNISGWALEDLQIPLPPLSVQQEIVELMDRAVARKQELEAKAEEMLTGVDGWLITELGIEKWDKKEEKKVFAVKTPDIKEYERFDPFFFQGMDRVVSKSNYKFASIKSITDYCGSGKTPPKDDYLEIGDTSTRRIIKAGSQDGDSTIDLNKVDFVREDFTGVLAKKHDIYILAAAHQAEYVGKKVYLLRDNVDDRTYFVGELLCIRANLDLIDPIFLFTVLNTELFKEQINREKRGQTSHIYGSDIEGIKIPLPPLPEQERIAKHISAIIEKAKAMRDEAKRVYEEARREVERVLEV